MPKALKICDFSKTKGGGKLMEVTGVSTAEMIRKLGPPTCTARRGETGKFGKTKQEWIVPMGGKSYLTVYDYKGFRWSLGGKSKDKAKAKKLKAYLEKSS